MSIINDINDIQHIKGGILMADETVKVLIRFPQNTLDQVEEYRHINRISSRHQAILELIEKGLVAPSGEVK